MTSCDPSIPDPADSGADLGGSLSGEFQSDGKAVARLDAPPATKKIDPGPKGSSKSRIDSQTIRMSGRSSQVEAPSDSSSDEASLPRELGDYELIEEVARGGMGVVFRAKQKRLNRIVALKVILAGQFAEEDDVLRFQCEAEAAANLQHPSIVPIYEVGEACGHHFFSMALIQGNNLAETCRKGPLSGHRGAQILVQIADAMDYAHQRGIIHRDLKPSNVIVNETGHAMVTDFGLAKRTDSDSQLTGTGQVIGTPNYMSPEQAAGFGDEIGPGSDVYSLGAVLYFLMTGRPPFNAANMMQTLRQVISQDPVAPRALNADIDRDLETICLRCLEKDPAARYPTANALAEDLRRFLNSQRIKARPIGRSAKLLRWCRRNRAVATLGSSLALALVLLSIIGPLLAFKETQLREQSELIADRTRELANDLQQSIHETEEAQEKAERSVAAMHNNLVKMYVDRGDSEVRKSDPVAALPSYAAALALDAGDPKREWGHRFRLTSILREAPRPVNIWRLTAETSASAFSTDGELVAAASRDGRLHVWNTKNNTKVLGPIDAKHESISVLKFSPDNRRLLVGANKTLQILDVETGRAEFSSERVEESIRDAVFHPQTNKVIVGIRSGAVFSLRTDSKEPRQDLSGHDRAVTCMAISPSAGRLVTASEDHTAKLYDVETESPIATLSHDGPVRWTCFDPSGELVATASDDGIIKFWDAKSGQARGDELHHGARIRVIKFDPSGTRLASGGWDANAKLWDVATGEQIGSPMTHQNSVPQLDFSPDGRFLATASLDHTAKIWSTETGREVCPAMHHGFLVQNVAFLPDGKRLVTAGADKMIRVWSFSTIAQQQSLVDHTDVVLSSAIDPDGRTLLTTCENGSAKLWGRAHRSTAWRRNQSSWCGEPWSLQSQWASLRDLRTGRAGPCLGQRRRSCRDRLARA